MHFIEYWNYASFQAHNEERYILILDKVQEKKPFMKRIKEDIEKKFGIMKKKSG